MREIVFDTETTGLSPAGGDRMVEIGCIEMVGRVETGRHYHCYFNPDRPMPSEAEAVHGLSDIFLSDKPRFADKADELLEFIGDSPLVAHNASFDFGFLNHELERCGRGSSMHDRGWSTRWFSPALVTRAPSTASMRCAPATESTGRSGSSTARCSMPSCLAQVYIELTGGRQIGLGLVADTPSMGSDENGRWRMSCESPARRALTPQHRRKWRATAPSWPRL